MSENNFSKSHTPNAKIGRKCHRSTKQAHRTQKANLSQLVEFKIRELESRTAAADALLERTGAGHKSDSAVDPLTILQQTYSEGGANGLADLMQKYSQALHASEKELLQARRRFEGHIREKDHTSSECSRVAQIRVKLESLSRELQKHNKLLIDDAKTRSTEHACRREEVSEKLRESITDITNKVEKQAEENQRMSDENDKLAEKLMELKMKFREKIESYQEQLTQRMESVQNLHNEVPLQQKKTESTAQTISLLNNKIQQYSIATLKMSEHIDLLKGKLSEFTDAREKTQEYSQTACAQKKNLNSKVEDIQSEKNRYVTKKEEHWKVREANGHELKELKQRIAMAEKMRRQKDLEFRKLNKKETPPENIS